MIAKETGIETDRSEKYGETEASAQQMQLTISMKPRSWLHRTHLSALDGNMHHLRVTNKRTDEDQHNPTWLDSTVQTPNLDKSQ